MELDHELWIVNVTYLMRTLFLYVVLYQCQSDTFIISLICHLINNAYTVYCANNHSLLTRIKLLIVHKKKINIQNWYLNFKGARDILTSLTHEVSALKSNYALCENANIFAANQLTRIQFVVCCTSLLQISLLGSTCMLLCCRDLPFLP